MSEFGWTSAGARRSSPVPAVPGDVILGCWPTLCSECQAHELVNRQRHDAEHQVAEHLGMSAHAYVPPSELVFEPPVDALHCRALVVAC